MKTILVPTDFSEVAENAALYAAQIAKKNNARIILLNAYHIPFVPSEVPVAIPTMNELEATAREGLVKTRSLMHTQVGPYIEIDLETRCGFAVEEIRNYIQEHAVDLVVMGMQGAGIIGEHLVGSVTTELFGQLHTPILAVNKGSHFNGIKNIVFAYDYIALEQSKTLGALKALARLFDAHIYVLKIESEVESGKWIQVPEAVAGVRMDHLLEGIHHSFHFVQHNNTVEGIHRFVSEKKADLVVMIPHQHSFFERIFSRSKSKHMAFHLQTPLLTLSE